MPVSGNEEAGVKPFARQPSSLDISGVPIKKRRFIRLPSPPSEEHYPPMMQKDAPQKEQGSPSEDSGSLVAGKTESSLKLSDATGTLVTKEMEGTCADPMQPSGSSTVIIEESSVVAHPGSLAKLDKEAKLLVAEKTADVLSSETAGLDSTHVKALIVDPVKELHDQKTEKGSKLHTSESPGKMASSIGLEEHPVSDLEDHRSRANSGIHKSQGSVCLKLSLSNDESLNQQKLEGTPSNTENSNVTESVNVSANRSNWDLNTTMDTWEATVGNESKITSEIQDLKPSICTAEIGGTDFAIKNQLHRDSDCRSGMSSTISQPAQQSMREHSPHLHLMQSFFSSNINQEPSSSSTKHFPGVVPHISLALAGNANMSNSRIVKPEPFDESSRHDSRGAFAIQLPNSKAVKLESIERLVGQEMLRLSNGSPVLNLIAPRTVKSEPFHESSPATYKRVEGLSAYSDNSALQGQDTRDQPTCSTSELQSQDTTGLGSSQSTDKPVLECQNMSIKPTCSTELSITSSGSEQVKHDSGMEGFHLGKELPKEASESGGVIHPSKNSLFGDHSVNESIVIGMTDTTTTKDKNAILFEKSKLTFVGEVSPAQNNKDHLISNEEKINLSGDIVEEDCYESEYDSDGNSMPMDIEEDGRKRDDIEDGEVREQGMDAAVEGCISKVLTDFSCDGAITSSLELQNDYVCTSLHVEGTEPLSEDPATTNIHAVKQYVGIEQKRMEDACKDPSVGESLAVGMPRDGGPEDPVIMTSQRQLLDVSREKDACKGQGTDNQANSGGQESSLTVAQDSDENVKLHDSENIYFAMPKVEVPLGDDGIKDPNNGGQRSRIINLSRASGEVALGKTRSIGSNTLTSYDVRERLPDGPLKGDRPCPRGRSEICSDWFHKLPGDRYQSHRNYRMNFVHGRGRPSSRSDFLRADKSSERNFAPEFNDCLSEYGVPRNKYVAAAAVAAAAAAAEADVKFTNHNVGPDGIFMASGRGRRKVGDDEENFRLSSRRRSSVGRDGPVAHGVQMVRRVPRSINEDGTEVVGLRRTEKFVRGISNDGGERAYSRNQPLYEGLDSHFVQGTRNFSSIQRRAPPRFRSKSPIRSRSPVPWSSSKKRSPDAFDGPQDLPHRGSPIYRMDRMRSPDHPGFPAEMVARRQGSPTFLSRSNDLRELDSGRDHGHPRSMLPNRSQPGRVVIRNNRRFGIINHRERIDGNELFGGSMHSGRFHEVGDGDVEERRRYGERRGPIRSFRPPFNGSDGENFHVGTEDRPLRFFRDDDQQFHERVNLRERPFERGIKNRSGNQTRRPRGIEDQEGSYTEQGLYDEEQEDLSRLKRKRF